MLADISDHECVLRELYSELSLKIDADTVAIHMFQQNQLTHEKLENIQSRHSEPIAAAKKLLNFVMKEPPSVYWCFLEALSQAGQEQLRKMVILESSRGQLNVF